MDGGGLSTISDDARSRGFFEVSKCKIADANHNYKFKNTMLAFKYSFSVRMVQEWNSVKRSVLEAENFKQFKNALKRFLYV